MIGHETRHGNGFDVHSFWNEDGRLLMTHTVLEGHFVQVELPWGLEIDYEYETKEEAS